MKKFFALLAAAFLAACAPKDPVLYVYSLDGQRSFSQVVYVDDVSAGWIEKGVWFKRELESNKPVRVHIRSYPGLESSVEFIPHAGQAYCIRATHDGKQVTLERVGLEICNAQIKQAKESKRY